jgi:hypothetical protein
MKEGMITVESCTDRTLVIYNQYVNKTWMGKGQKFYVDRDNLEQAYYDPAVEYLFKQGFLTTDDKTFMEDVGLIQPGKTESIVVKLDNNYLNRLIKLMPLNEFKEEIKKLTKAQMEDLADYAIEHYTDLKNDRIDILSKAAGRDILKAISNYKDSKEG